MNPSAPGEPPLLTIDQHIATIRLRRPQVANRIELSDLDVLRAQLEQLALRPEVLVLRVVGDGRHFCSGFNIAAIDGDAAAAAAAGVGFEALAQALEDARPITIAAIHGGVYGGGTDLALACDFRIGVQGMQLRMPAARLGLHYYASGLQRFVSRLGLAAAKRLFLLAETLAADELLRIGYLDTLVPPERLDAEVDTLAATLAGHAPLALRGMKQSLNEIARGASDPARLREREAACAASADLREGLAAFAAKREPQFTGR